MPPYPSDFTPHNSHLIYILLRRLIRGGVGAIPGVGSLLVEMASVPEELKLNKTLAGLNERVEGIQQRLEDSSPTKQVTGVLKDQSVLDKGKAVELKGSVKGLLSCLKHPSDQLAKDLRPVIERCAALQSVSQGRLIRKRKPYKREGANIAIGDLKIGHLFFPLSFLRQNLTTHTRGLKIPRPFDALFEPEDCKGLPKWICVEFEDDQFVVRAYPKPIRLDSAGRVYQLDEVVADPSNQFNSFEYWPNGEGSDDVDKIEFLVEMLFGKPLQLWFHEKGKVNSPILILTLSYNDE